MQNKGFSLIELLFTLTIAAIALSLATPNFASWINKYRLRGAAYDLLNDVQLARNEAINRATRVTISNNDSDWRTGWTVFIDNDNDGVHDAAETVLYNREGFANTMAITGNTSVSNMISYIATGESRLASGAFQAGTILVCAQNVDTARKLVISSNGRPRLEPIPRSGNC